MRRERASWSGAAINRILLALPVFLLSVGIAHALEIQAPKVALQGVTSSLSVTGAGPGVEVFLLAGR